MRVELDRIHKSSGEFLGVPPRRSAEAARRETFSGVYGNMSEQTEWLANPRFAALASGQAFKMRDLREGNA